MDAKELHQTMSMCHPNNWVITNPEIRATILRALSLLAAVEDGDEIVQRLNQTIEPGKPGFIRSNLERREAAARIVSDAQEIAALKGELEDERIRLAACGVVAMANTPESAAKMRQMKDKYRSASLSDVERAVDAEMALRAELASVKAHADAMYADLDALRCGLGQTVSQFKSARDYRAAHPKEGA